MSTNENISTFDLLVEVSKALELFTGPYVGPGTTVEDLRNLKARIDAKIFTPSEAAIDLVNEIRDLESYGGGDYEFYLTTPEAAARIEGLQHKVPLAMLEEIVNLYPCYIPGKEPNALRAGITAVANQYKVKVEG